jgi:hypothetical protein
MHEKLAIANVGACMLPFDCSSLPLFYSPYRRIEIGVQPVAFASMRPLRPRRRCWAATSMPRQGYDRS